MTLHRFWITFERDDTSPVLAVGMGVTASDRADALDLAGEFVEDLLGADTPLPPVASVDEDVDVSTLDPGHVLHNMRLPVERGVWFPM